MTDVAIAHKDYAVRGGGERLAEELARTFSAPLYVRGDAPGAADDVDVRTVESSRALEWAAGRGGVLNDIATPVIWRQDTKELYDYDVIVASGAKPRWFKAHPTQVLVSYTHATPRNRTDRWPDRDFSGVGGRLSGLVDDAFELLYMPNLRRPDLFVCNSEVVERRVRQAWNVPERDTAVVYPPVETGSFGPGRGEGRGDYYLTLSRLDGRKRIAEMVEAFNETGRELRIAGDGPEREALEEAAGDTVKLLGRVSEPDKRKLLADADAFVFNAVSEDFGITPVEALASGTPVIGVDEGFTAHQVRDGDNGVLYERGELARALDRFEDEGVSWSARRIADAAEVFGVERFRREMREAVDEAARRAEVEADPYEGVRWARS